MLATSGTGIPRDRLRRQNLGTNRGGRRGRVTGKGTGLGSTRNRRDQVLGVPIWDRDETAPALKGGTNRRRRSKRVPAFLASLGTCCWRICPRWERQNAPIWATCASQRVCVAGNNHPPPPSGPHSGPSGPVLAGTRIAKRYQSVGPKGTPTVPNPGPHRGTGPGSSVGRQVGWVSLWEQPKPDCRPEDEPEGLDHRIAVGDSAAIKSLSSWVLSGKARRDSLALRYRRSR